ncbi:MAG: dephospho-CoA kinase [Thermodesulfovibrionia bacterium]|nr:dephospho-CoA kinase [Thermodesulfovibrionia bacterium]
MPFIGLTGSLGTGKTTVLKFFRKSGAYTINADRLVHELLKNPRIIKKLSRHLGRNILTKINSKTLINKKSMADIIFNDPQKRRYAEKTIHPEVIKRAKNMKRKILVKERDAVIVFEVPLLFEAGYEKIFDKIIFVYCSKAKATERLRKRGLSREQVLKRMQAQLPTSWKKAAADFLINNNSAQKDIKPQVQKILKKIIGKK